MCSGDLTPVVFQWDEYRQMNFPHFDVLHSCRSWDKIIDWAEEHQLVGKWEPKVHAVGFNEDVQ